jgi:hypothetical protein
MPPSASGRDVHHDTPLTNVAIMAFQSADAYIAQQLLPVVPVGKQGDRYYIIDKDSWLRVPTTSLRAAKTPARKIEFQVSSDAYYANNYALRNDNSKEDLANADAAIRLRDNSARFTTDMLLRDYETRVANLLTSGTNLGSYVALAGGAKWSDFVNSDPLSDVASGSAFIENNTGLMANTLVIDRNTLRIIRRHPQILDLYKFTTGGQVTMDQLKDAFQVSTILVGQGVKNNALENATASITNIWGNNVLLAHIEPAASLQTATLGLSFRWMPPGIAAPMQAMRYDDPDPSVKVEWVEVGYYQDERLVAPSLGYGILGTL